MPNVLRTKRASIYFFGIVGEGGLLVGDEMNDEQEHIRFSRVVANAVAAAMRIAHAEMPEASEKRRLLLVLANAAASCGILRIEFDDVTNLVAGAYKQGSQLPAPSRETLFDT